MQKILSAKLMKSLVTDGSIAILSLLTFMFLTHYLTIEVYGLWIIYISAVALIDMCRTGLIKTPMIYFINSKHIKISVITNSFYLGLILNIILLLLLVPSYFLFPKYSMYILAYCLLMFTDLPYSIYLYKSYGDLSFKIIFTIKFSLKILFLIFVLYFFSEDNLNITTLLISHVTVSFIVSAFVLIRKKIVINIDHINISMLKKLSRYGRYTIGNLIATNLLKSTDIYIITFALSTSDVAIYAVAIKAIDLLEYPIRALMNVLFPVLSKLFNSTNYYKMKQTYQSYVFYTTIALIPLLIALFIYSEKIIIMLAGSQYISASYIFRCFLIYAFFLPIDKFTGALLDGTNNPKINLKKVLLMCVLNGVLDIVLIYFFPRIETIAYVSIFTFLFGTSYSLYYIRKLFNLDLSKFSFYKSKPAL